MLQFRLSLARSVSQPFTALPSQSPKPALHDSMRQTPKVHVAAALRMEQAIPQPPQSVTVFRDASQPSATIPLQSPYIGAQDPMSHVPALQIGVPFMTEQATSQRPQLPTSLARLVSHPVAGSPSQSSKPSSHEKAQAPAEQIPVACIGAGHSFSQRPQFCGSLDVSTQLVPHGVRAPQSDAQTAAVPLLSQSGVGASH
jgi:hypothetical protein